MTAVIIKVEKWVKATQPTLVRLFLKENCAFTLIFISLGVGGWHLRAFGNVNFHSAASFPPQKSQLDCLGKRSQVENWMWA